MRAVLGLICVLLLLGPSGCATPPAPNPYAAQTDYDVHGTAGYGGNQSALLPIDPELEGPHSVDAYVQVALERNPDVLAARRAVSAQSETIPQVTALDDPMLMESFQPLDDHSVQTAAGRGTNVVSLSQKFPWFGKLQARGAVAEQETQIALTRLAQTELRVTEAVQLAYYELTFNQQAIQITEEDRSLLEDLLKFAEARYRTGATSQQDVLSAQVELDQLENRLLMLRRQYRQAQADLAKLLHTSTEADVQAAGAWQLPAVPERIDRLYEAAVRCQPELQERLHAIVKAQRSEEVARLQYYPDVTLGVSWQAITADQAISPVANGNDNLALNVGVNLPIWREKLDAAVNEAEHRVFESARRYDATRDDTFRTIKRLMVQARALEEQIELFRDNIIPRSMQTLRVSAADYRVGKVDFQQIIDNWSDLLAFQIQLARLQSTLGGTLASLERSVGCQLAELPLETTSEP